MKFIFMSVLVHLSIIWGLRTFSVHEAIQPEKPQPIRLKMNNEKGTLEHKKERGNDKENFVEQDDNSIIQCKYHYFGIGWTGSVPVNGWCKIDEIAPKSPLARIGVKLGWYIKLQDDMCPGRGPENSDIKIVYKDSENGIENTIVLKREKICMR